MRKKFKKISSVLFSIVMGAAMVVPSFPVSAQELNATNQSSNTETKAPDNKENTEGKIAVKIDSGAGTVKVTTSNGNTQSVSTDENGKASVTKSDGSKAIAQADKNGYLLTVNDTVGKQVTVEAVSAKGYKVSAYKVTSDAGTVVKKSDADDQIKVITLGSQTAVADISFTKESDSAKAENIGPNDVKESKDKVQADSDTDPAVTAYLTKNINTRYTKISKMDLVNVIRVKQTLVEKSKIPSGFNMTNMENDKNKLKTFASATLGQMVSNVTVYNVDDDSKYAVAYINTMQNDSSANVIESTFAHNNDHGEVVKGVIYDKSTGIAYIPKDLFQISSKKAAVYGLQAQLLQAVNTSGDHTSSSVSAVTQTDGDDKATVTEKSSSIYKNTTVKADKNLDSKNLLVSVNGLPIDKSDYKYNPSTGNVTIAGSSASIGTVSVNAENKSVTDKVKELLEPTKVEAAPAREQVNFDQMVFANDALIPASNIANGQLYKGNAELTYGKQDGNDRYWSYEHRAKAGINNTTDNAGKTAVFNFIKNGGSLPSSGWTRSVTDKKYSVFVNFYANFAYRSPNNFSTDDGKKIDMHNLGDVGLECTHIAANSPAGPLNGKKGSPKVGGVWMRVVSVNQSSQYAVVAMVTAGEGGQAGIGLFKLHTIPPEGYATAHKASSNTAISGGNAQYSLDGAEYRIYSDQACTKYTGKGFHFDANGNNTWGNQKLTPGTYYAKEYKAPKGFKADSTVYKFNVTSGNTTNNPVKVDIKENPDYGTLSFQKLDAETGKATPQKGTLDGKNTTFKDAQYTFTYSDGAKKTYTWVMKTDENGKIEWDDAHYVSGDKLIKNDDKAVIPLGTVTYKETKAPLGYNLDPDSHTVEIKAGSKVSAKTESTDIIVRGNMNWIKTKIQESASDGITMQGIYFKIKNNDTGEVQYVRSDTKNTQGGVPGLTNTSSKTCYQYDYNPKTKTGTLLKNTDGTPKHVWFGAGDYTPSKGALTVGEYTVTEMPTAPDKSQGIEGNIGDDLAHFGHKVKANGTDTIAIKTGKNGSSTIVDYPVKIHTSASTDHKGEHTVIKGKTATIYDNLQYENLTPGRTYKVRSVIVDKTTGQSVAEATSDLVTSDKNINKKTGNADGSIELKIPVDTSKWQDNHDYVVTEYLTWEDMEIKNETDLSLTEQTIYPLTVHTTAADAATKDNVARASKTVTINDDVAYWGLTVGKEYTISGTLMNKATGKPVVSNGKEVTATKKFKAPSKDGKVTMTFTFDSSALQGQDIVAFEKVIPQNGEVYTHADINDAPQTVHIPKIGTTAKDSQTKEHIGVVGKKATLVDTVAYSNLVVGKEYTMKGKLMDKATGKPFTVDGKEITASKTFKADKKDGSVDLTYTFDSSALQGKDLVVFEDLYHNDINVASHADIKDEGQTVHYPGVHTTATDKNTKTHTGAKDEKETIVDMVKYTNVIPGKSYTITGTLMDKETGKPYTENGKEVTATKTFAAEKTEGEVELDYTVDTSALKEAKTFVVFEDLKYGDVTLVSHADLKDEGQSVNIPSGHTEAADSVTNDQVGTVGKKVTTVDHVIYKNLTPGETYTVKGTVMNPETGKALQENGKDITAEKTFTAKESDGTVDITFTYDSSVLKGKSIVVFEDVYSNDIPVIINEDLKDTKEYIYYPEIHTSASASGQKNDVKAGKIEITDTVSYKNLIPGKEYDLKGLLMDKTSGQPVKGLFGSVKGETKFTPKTADGSVEVKFSFDASQYAGKTVVVFEDLYHNDKPVTDHHDINDQAQSVSFAEASPKTGITGNKTTLIILIVCVAAAAGVICTVLHKKKTPDDTTKPEEKSKE